MKRPIMKKTFRLQVPGKDSQRVVELVRSEVGKYLNREKRKALPIEGGHWEFACRVGPDAAAAEVVDVKQLPGAIDQLAAAGAESVYVEILASAQPRSLSGDTHPSTDV